MYIMNAYIVFANTIILIITLYFTQVIRLFLNALTNVVVYFCSNKRYLLL